MKICIELLELLKGQLPQHKDEISLSVMVTKVEKSIDMNIWLNPKYSLK